MAIVQFIFSTALSLAAIAVALANLQPSQREWLLTKSRATMIRVLRIADVSFALVSFGNGVLGSYLFYVAPGLPTRADIMALVMFFANIAIGVWRFYAISERRMAASTK